MVLILGIESSCDDTAAALVTDEGQVVAEVVRSQAELFATWGGVVPELSARYHVAATPGVVAEALALAGLDISAVNAVAVSAWPGLMGSLLTGVTMAKVIAARRDLPLIGVDHIQAHIAAVHLGGAPVEHPLVALVASGGHSHFYHCPAPGLGIVLGGTIDDAAGEAFDKAASMLGLGYPGGPEIDARSEGGDPQAFTLPRSFLNDQSLRLSFAGLKTSLLYRVRGPLGRDPLTLDAQGVRDACASFQAAVVDCLVGKLVLAARQHQVGTVVVAGGVACNRALRRRLGVMAAAEGLRVHVPEARHCTDNGAMVAMQGAILLAQGTVSGPLLTPLPTGRAGPRQAKTST